MLYAQQRLETIGEVNRRQCIEIPYPRTRPLANPEQVVAVFFLRSIAILNNALMQSLQGLVSFDGHITQTEIGHTEVVAADQEHSI
ncbi:hypothetical protein SDC9_116842 [bioreactor metagenome]|uniref:Uncharacterized protein n=1 Tax=bioreactor metagenome TaxID=1076179 RepID=A0A645C7F8_9ZZZZ